MDAEKVDEWRDVVGAERPVIDFLTTGSNHDGVQFVVLADAANDQARPVNRHGIRSCAFDNPEWRLVGQVPSDDGSFICVASPKLGGKIRFQAEHVRISMGVSSQSPRHIPECLSDFTADEQTGMKIDLIFVSQRYEII